MRRTGDRSQRRSARLPIRRIVGWAGIDGNPLRRGMDRLERLLWIGLLVAFLVTAPLLVPLAGRAARTDSIHQVKLERSWRQVNAVLLGRVPASLHSYDSAATAQVNARWRAPSGATRSGMVPAEPGAPAGTKLRIWVDWAGRFTGTEPLSASLVAVRVLAIEILVTVGLAVTGLGMAGLVRWLLNRRRMTYWTIEWACFGPRWSARH